MIQYILNELHKSNRLNLGTLSSFQEINYDNVRITKEFIEIIQSMILFFIFYSIISHILIVFTAGKQSLNLANDKFYSPLENVPSIVIRYIFAL